MVRAGVDPAIAMKISGHRPRHLRPVQHIIDERDIAAALERTQAYVAKLPVTSNVTTLKQTIDTHA